jgi:hypothetical protein
LKDLTLEIFDLPAVPVLSTGSTGDR